MPIYGGSYNGPREVHYLFIDGASLRGKLDNVSREFFGGKPFRIDFTKFVADVTKVFYYDATPVREPSESESAYNSRVRPQRDLLDSAASIDGIHVYEGDARRRRRGGLQQKKVDVMITVDMLTHSFRRNMHKATLLTGDNDFKPLIDALVQEGMFVTLWYPTGESSKELLNAADSRKPLGFTQLYELLSPESQSEFSIPIPNGITHLHSPPGPGIKINAWNSCGVEYGINKLDNEYIFLQYLTSNSCKHIKHHNIDLLRAYCKEIFNVSIPPL